MSGFEALGFVILALFAVIAVIAAAVLLWHRMAELYGVPRLSELFWAWVKGRNTEQPSDLQMIHKRLRHSIGRSFTIGLDGQRHAGKSLVVRMNNSDLAEIARFMTVNQLAKDAATAYRNKAVQNSLVGTPEDSMDVYVMGDDSRRNNDPALTLGRPRSGGSAITVHFEDERIEAVRVPDSEDVSSSPSANAAADDPTQLHWAKQASEPDEESPLDDMLRRFTQMNGEATTPMPTAQFRIGSAVACLLTPGEVQVGRDKGCEFRVTDPTVSRHHASISYRGNAWILTPKEGCRCLINDRDVFDATVLSSGDLVKFGGSISAYAFEASIP